MPISASGDPETANITTPTCANIEPSGNRFFYVALPDDASCPDCEARKSETDTPCFVHRLTVPLDDPEAEVTRFFYVAKASRRERNAGLEGMPERDITRVGQTEWTNRCQSCGASRPQSEATCGRCGGEVAREDRAAPVHANGHPTVKPIALMRWLVRLVTPPGGLILDPFAGSGSTGCAAVLEGFRFVGIEQDESYAEIAERRIAFWRENGDKPVRASGPKEPTVRSQGWRQGGLSPRCPQHGESRSSGSRHYRCGCPFVRGKEHDPRLRQPRPTAIQPALPLEGAAD